MNILILGAGSGLSRSVARLFGKKGFSITLVARSKNKLKEEITLLQNEGIASSYYVADLSDRKALSNVLDKFHTEKHLPDVILFNAFANASGGFAEETWDGLKKELDINVGAAFNLLKEMLPIYQKSGKGSLFFTGGGFGITPSPDYIGVSIGKATLRNLVHAAALQMKDSKVHIATLTVMGFIGGDDPKYAPDRIAEAYWKLYNQQPDEFDTEIIY